MCDSVMDRIRPLVRYKDSRDSPPTFLGVGTGGQWETLSQINFCEEIRHPSYTYARSLTRGVCIHYRDITDVRIRQARGSQHKDQSPGPDVLTCHIIRDREFWT